MVKTQRRLNAEKNIKQAREQVKNLKKELAEEKRNLKKIIVGKAQAVRITNSEIQQINKDLKMTQTFITKQTKALKNL